MESPLPRTPKPQRFFSPPKTPATGLLPSFGPDESENAFNFTMGMSIARPDSALSTCSNSSDSSVDSNTTYATTAASCTSVEDNDEKDHTPMPKGRGNHGDYLAVPGQETPTPAVEQLKKKKKTVWTEDMDAHLWKTYCLYQADPKMTPFYIVPGHAPPLGVCHKVAREARRTWKEEKLSGMWKSALNTPKPRVRRTVSATEPTNRGDAMRKTSLYSFPASESSARRRLRELCRQNYVPSRKPYHLHQQGRRSAASNVEVNSRPTTVSPSPVKRQYGAARDPLSSTRGMALSLATSTASSMMPGGVLATITAGGDLGDETPAPGRSDYQFGGIAEVLHNASPEAESRQSLTPEPSVGETLASAFQMHSQPVVENPVTPADIPNRRASLPAGASSRTLLPPLELKSSGSPYGTWPRRLKRPDLDDDAEFNGSATPAPPQRRVRRGNLSDLFGEPSEAPQVPHTAPLKTRSRVRGYTISAGTNPFSTRRRVRPSAPLLTVTGPVSYDSPNGAEDGSPLSKRERPDLKFDEDEDGLPKRLGSPFMERLFNSRK